ncbi:MAG: hypothetical protein BM485_05890 [Desulfobulbaceae bacterium DB1]|nr:MAG: hypothetical protein BM485_05890 [Desulfobulbaceae bacterium DB1]
MRGSRLSKKFSPGVFLVKNVANQDVTFCFCLLFVVQHLAFRQVRRNFQQLVKILLSSKMLVPGFAIVHLKTTAAA